jgi:hypothetical protein
MPAGAAVPGHSCRHRLIGKEVIMLVEFLDQVIA